MTTGQPPEPPGGPSSGQGEGSPPPQPGAGQPAAPPPPQGWPQQPPPGYGQQPPWGWPQHPQQPPPGAPGYGQGHGQAPSWGAPPPGYGQQPPPGYGQQPPPGYGPPPGWPPPGYGPPAYGHAGPGAGTSVDFGRLRVADYVVAGGTLLFLVLALLPWQSFDDVFGFSLSGFQSSGAVSAAFVMFLLATAWALLPAFYDAKLSFPRAWVTVGLAALGFLLTLVGWIASLDAGFSVFALLGLLAAAAVLLFSLFTLLPELRNRPALPGALSGAAQWANQHGGPPQPAAYGQGGPPPPPPPPPTPTSWATAPQAQAPGSPPPPPAPHSSAEPSEEPPPPARAGDGP